MVTAIALWLVSVSINTSAISPVLAKISVQ